MDIKTAACERIIFTAHNFWVKMQTKDANKE